MSKYVFATLAIGATYQFKVRTLIDCVLTMTKGDLIIITDDVNEIRQYIEFIRGDMTRVRLYDFNALTTERIWYAERIFNYNLKRLPTMVAHKQGDYDLIIHADADGFMINWDEEEFQKFVDDPQQGMIARFRNRPCEEGSLGFLLEPKATKLSINLVDIKARLPIEVFMFFKPKCEEFTKFLEHWEFITKRANERNVDPFIEALEISYALSEAKLPHYSILDYMNKYPVIHNFRYLHQDKIMRVI